MGTFDWPSAIGLFVLGIGVILTMGICGLYIINKQEDKDDDRGYY